MKEINIFDIGGFKIGHAEYEEAGTGCTVVLLDEMSPAGVDVRGGGPASRESQLLSPQAAAEGIHGLLLSGGSAFSLDAAGGVLKYLEERDIGFDVGVTKVPLVCQSALFDLTVGDYKVRPNANLAYKACEKANSKELKQGNVGAGIGCSVGKLKGMDFATKTGFGVSAIQVGELKIGAIVAVNAFGDIFDSETGKQIAGLQGEDKKSFTSTLAEMTKTTDKVGFTNTNTTIGAIITNGKFTKSQLCKISGMAHNGFARGINPVHTMVDGDTIYSLSVGEVESDINLVGSLSAYVMAKAITNSVKYAESKYDIPCAKDVLV